MTKAALNAISADLVETYARISIDRAKTDIREGTIAFISCRWIPSAERTLNWSELEVAIALPDPNSEVFEDSVKDVPTEPNVISACGGAIHLSGNQMMLGDATVTFTHVSLPVLLGRLAADWP